MDTHHEQETQAPTAAPSADAGEEVNTATTAGAPAAPPSNEGNTTTAEDAPAASGPSPQEGDPTAPLWDLIECHHKGCDKCHASMNSNEVVAKDVNNRYEKVVQVALRMICAFHEEAPMIKSVDLSNRSDHDISCLVVEVSTSEWPEGW